MPRELGDTRLRRMLRPVLRPAVGRVQRWRRRNLTDRERWEQALPDMRWWRRLLADPETPRHWGALRDDYAWSEREPYARVAGRLPMGTVRVLDVGAGPVSALPKVLPGRTFD